jgi:hypothetical protein
MSCAQNKKAVSSRNLPRKMQTESVPRPEAANVKCCPGRAPNGVHIGGLFPEPTGRVLTAGAGVDPSMLPSSAPRNHQKKRKGGV